MTGDKNLDLKELLTDSTYNDDQEEWDALDEENSSRTPRETSIAKKEPLGPRGVRERPTWLPI